MIPNDFVSQCRCIISKTPKPNSPQAAPTAFLWASSQAQHLEFRTAHAAKTPRNSESMRQGANTYVAISLRDGSRPNQIATRMSGASNTPAASKNGNDF